MSENSPRRRDFAYEALAEVTHSDLAANRGELNVSLKTIRAMEPELDDSYLLADLIHERAKQYRQVMGEEVLITPTALAKHWRRVGEEAVRVRKPQGTNLSAEPASPLPKKHEIPEWVNVWHWSRRKRAPRNMRPFPQQEQFSDPTLTMSMQEYEALKAEWLAAGAPGFDLKTLTAETLRRNYAAEVGDLLAQINT